MKKTQIESAAWSTYIFENWHRLSNPVFTRHYERRQMTGLFNKRIKKNNKTNRSLWKRTRRISVENINETRIPLQAIFPQIILDRISLTRHIFENNSPFQRISYVCRFYCWWNRKVSLVYQRTYHQLLQPFLGNLSAVCLTAFFLLSHWSRPVINS